MQDEDDFWTRGHNADGAGVGGFFLMAVLCVVALVVAKWWAS